MSDTEKSRPAKAQQREKRLLRALLYAVVGLIALAALGASLWLRDDAIDARKEQVRVANVAALTGEQMVLLEEAIDAGRIDATTYIKWDAARYEAEGLSRLLATKAHDEPLAGLRGALTLYNDSSREVFSLLTAGDVARAEQVRELRVHPLLDRADTFLTALDRNRGEQAERDHAAATTGTLLAFAVAVLLIAMLLRRAQRDKRSAAVTAAEEAALQRSERRFRALIENASDMIFVVDSHGAVTLASGAVEEQLGRNAVSLVGSRLVDLLHPEDVELAVPLLAEAIEHRPRVASVEWRIAREDGSFAHVSTVARDLTEDEHVGGLVLTTRDVSERRAFEDQLRHQAFHDPLTNLPNRALFDDRVAHALSRENRADRHVAVLFVDLDDFKAINDTLGHAVGDQLLIGVAGRLRSCLRSADTAARLGGDEFGVLLEDLDHSSHATAAARRALETLREPFFIHGQPVHVQASIGLAVARARTTRAEQLVRDADVAMYLAKHNGKARFEIYDAELQRELLESLEIPSHEAEDGISWFLRSEGQRAEIEALLDHEDSLTPVFQPIVELAGGNIVGYEALSRFPDAGRPPNAWFAQAHRCGLGVELEMLALRTALRAEGRPPGTYLSLNLSPSAVVSDQLDRNLPDDLSSVVFEIVENELLGEGSRLDFALDRLRGRGARVAVDDTGSGYAGLKQLMRLRPEIIKLDRSLVHGVHTDLAKRALVEAMVRYARRIDASVCAEGVETLDDLQVLADIDIGTAQGYVLARPGPPWAAVDREAAAVCARSMQVAMGETPAASTTGARGMERVSRAILSATWPADLQRAIEMIGAELNADRTVLFRLLPDADCLETVTASGANTAGERFALEDYWAARTVVRGRHAVHVRVSDPGTDPNHAAMLVRRGLSAMLLLPVISGETVIGLLGLGAAHERPWTRSQIHRAWIFAHELGAALAAFEREGKEPLGRRLAHRDDFAATGIDFLRRARKGSTNPARQPKG